MCNTLSVVLGESDLVVIYAKKKRVQGDLAYKTIFIGLRSPHVQYLERIARQRGLSVSGAFGLIVEENAFSELPNAKPPRKETKHLLINPKHAAILDKLAIRSGLYKADIARRLIDEAMVREEMAGG